MPTSYNFIHVSKYFCCILYSFCTGNDKFVTTGGGEVPANQVVNLDYQNRELKCYNKDNSKKNKPKPPRRWFNRKITCDDYKVQ